MKLSRRLLLLTCSAALLSNPSIAQERTTQLGKVGAWAILAIDANGKLHRCTAEFINGHGSLRLALVAADGSWSLSVPGEGLKGDPIVFSATYNQLSVPAADFKNHGGHRLSAPVSPRWVTEFRNNGTLKMQYGGKKKEWAFVNTGPAMQAVSDCVRNNK
jgi:hypothetical protein